MPGAAHSPAGLAADRPVAAAEAVPDRQSQQASARELANPVEPPGAAVAVALARNPAEPPGADSPGAAVVLARTPEALAVGALGHTPAQPVGVQGRYFVSGLQSKHCRTISAFYRRG